MFLIDLVVIVVFAIIIGSHSTRIASLERQLRDQKGVPQPGPTPQPGVSQPIRTNAQPQPFLASTPATGQFVAPNATSSAPVSAPKSEESSGKILGGVGIAAVIIGISFFLKYAFDNNWIDPMGRVILGIIAGIILLGIGQALRKKYVGYSDFLMGGGIAVLYLSMYSAYAFYNLVSPATAGLFMFVVTVLGFAISIANATIALAVVSALGGFFTPALISNGQDNMINLFSYLTILNIGVLAVSFFKKWPELIFIAFIGTALNFVAWFGSYYKPAVLGPTLIFCFIAFLIFLIASVARAISGKAKADNINYFLLGANAFLFAIVGYIILSPEYHEVLGFAAVFIALIYMAVAFIINKANPEDKALNIFLPGLAVTFLSIAVPLQFSGPWIAVAWFVEAVALYVISSFIGNRGFQIMGVVVYVLGLINLFFFNMGKGYDASFIVIFNSTFMVFVLAIVAAYLIAYMYRRYGSETLEIQKRGIVVFIIIANVLTVYAISSQIIFSYGARTIALEKAYYSQSTEIQRYKTGNDANVERTNLNKEYNDTLSGLKNQSNTWVSIFWTVYAALLTAIGFGMRKSSARRLGLVLFLITAVKVFIDVWNLGQIYRVVSFIVFGIIALAASFAYAKYKDRLKEIV